MPAPHRNSAFNRGHAAAGSPPASPSELDLDRELHALRAKKNRYDTAIRTAREKPAQQQEALAEARVNRLTAAEEMRLEKLAGAHQRIAALRKKIDAGTLDRDEGERQIKRLAGLVAKKPAT